MILVVADLFFTYLPHGLIAFLHLTQSSARELDNHSLPRSILILTNYLFFGGGGRGGGGGEVVLRVANIYFKI